MLWLVTGLFVLDVVLTLVVLKMRNDRRTVIMLAHHHGFIYIPRVGWQRDMMDIPVYHIPPLEV